MSQDPQQVPSLFTQFDVAANSSKEDQGQIGNHSNEVIGLLQDILAAQDRQNQLFEEFISQMNATQRQRASELGQWKQDNPMLARFCRQAAESLSRAQTEYLRKLTDEVNSNADSIMDGEFMLNELVDRYGPRLAHLNGVLQVLMQLGNASKAAGSENKL